MEVLETMHGHSFVLSIVIMMKINEKYFPLIFHTCKRRKFIAPRTSYIYTVGLFRNQDLLGIMFMKMKIPRMICFMLFCALLRSDGNHYILVLTINIILLKKQGYTMF